MTRKIVIQEKLSTAKDAPVRPPAPVSTRRNEPTVRDGQTVVIAIVLAAGIFTLIGLFLANAGS